ncbi:FGGY-family carbohydrate kinase [Escherichia coli]
MERYFICVDLGGTETKAGIYTAEGREIGVSSQVLPLLSPCPGFCERDMEALWKVTCQVISLSMSENNITASQIDGISFSAHGKGLYLLDRQGKPLRHGIVSSDSRAQQLVASWKEQGIDRESYHRSLQQLWPSHPVALLHWLKKHETDNYGRIGTILMVHDYIRSRLTGKLACEETNISGSNFYNQYTSAYDAELFRLFEIKEVAGKVPDIIGSADLAGVVTSEAASQCGLLAGTPVFGGVFDVVGAALTSGIYDSTTLSAVAGTWSIATRIFDRIIPSDYPYVWGKFSIPGTFFAHEGSPTSASNLTWFLQQFLPDLPDSYRVINEWVERGYEKQNDILFFPWLFGSNYHEALSGGFLGLCGHHKREDLVYAIYQGIVFSHLLHQDRLIEIDKSLQTIRFSGGPTHSRIWMQMFCDASNMPLEIVDIEQSGCRAAAMCAAVGGGAYSGFKQAMKATHLNVIRLEPNVEKAHMLRRRFARFKQVASALSSVV